MKCAANYEIRAECSVVADDQVLKFEHPKGLYRACLKWLCELCYMRGKIAKAKFEVFGRCEAFEVRKSIGRKYIS